MKPKMKDGGKTHMKYGREPEGECLTAARDTEEGKLITNPIPFKWGAKYGFSLGRNSYVFTTETDNDE